MLRQIKEKVFLLVVNSKKNLFLTEKLENFEVKEDNYLEVNNKEDIINICNFYRDNLFLVEGNIYLIIEEVDINKYYDLNCQMVTIRKNKESPIIGSMLSIFLGVRFSDFLSTESNRYGETGSYHLACSTYLNTNYKYRNKGYGLEVIKYSLNILKEVEGIGAYFINNKSRCFNSIPLKVWVVNHKNMTKQTKSSFNLIKDEESIIKSHKYLLEKGINKKMYFYPKLEYWRKWVQIFPSYIIIENDNITGLFSFNIEKIKTIHQQILQGASLFFYVSDNKNNIYNVMEAANVYDYLALYEIGDINLNILKEIRADLSTRRHINFYNISSKFLPHEVYIPIL